jgi:hypothetical protein
MQDWSRNLAGPNWSERIVTQTHLKPGDKVRLKSDTEWHGIPLVAGDEACVLSIGHVDRGRGRRPRQVERAWVEFVGEEKAAADLDPDLLELI